MDSDSDTHPSAPRNCSHYFDDHRSNELGPDMIPTDVAIVGLSCRTAGGNDTPEKLWDFLLSKKHASGDIPSQRWEPWLHKDPRNTEILENIIRKGYFLDNLENFDAAFFGISPKEAELMDPHQRLGLELAWEALENAGIDTKSLVDSDTAVYMGVDSDDYSRVLMEDLPSIEAWSGIGTAYHGIPNRISYHLGLQGPSTAVDAACASSLIAIHLARQAIVSGESTIAICGGVNVICAPGLTHMLQKAGALSPEGVCRSFDDKACGYARGEGGAVVVLKRLSAAIRDNDNILAVLKSTASAQDGKTNGIMAPNPKAQELVARQALRRAGDIDPRTIQYVEAHATSTSLGDPTEIEAIAQVYGAGRLAHAPCYVGSIKPNIGHLEAAAGAIGFVKAVLSIQKGEIAPQTLLGKLNTKVDWSKSGLEVVRETTQWPQCDKRRAAVCCYGYGGSVCHAILEEAPTFCNTRTECEQKQSSTPASVPVTLVLSANQERRLASHAASLAHWLTTGGQSESLSDIARTISMRRAAHDYRVAFVVSTHHEAVQALTEFSAGKPSQDAISNRVIGDGERNDVVWVFSGHGAQWSDMGKELLHSTVFRKAVTTVDIIVEREMNFSVLEAFEHGWLGDSDRVQILTYAVQIGLAAVLKSQGILPQAIIGHSVGEIAAAVTAGCLTTEEGAIIVSRRAKLYAQVQGRGAMALVQLPFDQVESELSQTAQVVAAIQSSPTSCVVSGSIEAVENYLQELNDQDVKCWKVQTDIAFHSPSLQSLVSPLRDILGRDLYPQPSTIPIYSTSHTDARTAVPRNNEYWTNNMTQPVLLVGAVKAAVEDGYRIFLEVSSHPIVSHSISETLATLSPTDTAAFGVMNRKCSPQQSIVHAVSHLHTLGAHVDFQALFGTGPWSTVVPNTPWVHKSHWKITSRGTGSISQQHAVNKHTLLGSGFDIAGTDLKVWTTVLDDKTKPYPLSHPLDGTEIIPAAVYCNTFREATGANVLKSVRLRVPTPMTADQREIQIVVQGENVRMSSRLTTCNQLPVEKILDHAWIEHSTAKHYTSDMALSQSPYSLQAIIRRIGTQLPNEFAWNYLQKIGVSGIAFPWAVLEHFGNNHEMLVKMDMDPSSESTLWNKESWAPFLDAATSVGSSIFFESVRMRIVSGIDEVHFISKEIPPKIGYLFVENRSERRSCKADISILSQDGTLLAKLQGMRFSDVEARSEKSTGVDSLVHHLAWVPPIFSETPSNIRNVVFVSADSQILDNYVNTLELISQSIMSVLSCDGLREPEAMSMLQEKGAMVIYLPGVIHDMKEVGDKVQKFTLEAASILELLGSLESSPRLYVITDSAYKSQSPTALAQYPLHGFARVAASEYPDIWGGLIDNEGPAFPLLSVKYVHNQSVIRIQDGLPRVARMRPFQKAQRYNGTHSTMLPRPNGTYLVTGGFGDIGLEILDFLVQKGARRIVVVSRRKLPPRRNWPSTSGSMATVIRRVEELEKKGASIHAIALDISLPTACSDILAILDHLSLPPVLGVVHAAGVSGYGFIKDATSSSFADVMGPKVQGALSLNNAFPPGTLEFFVCFSSIGQIIGTPGQSAYASSNAFLDSLATQRRLQGCNSISIQWTAWRGLGLASNTALVDLELQSKGVTDISIEEGFLAWEYLSSVDTDHAVVTRTRVFDVGEALPCSLIEDIVQRRTSLTSCHLPTPSVSSTVPPKTGPELEIHIKAEIRGCLATVLHMDVEDIDDRAAVTDLGVDSVMTVALRQQLQKTMGIKVPPTLTWNHPTVNHLVRWFYTKLDNTA